jgi:hypothetical protein
VEIVFLEVKIGRQIVSDLYTELYTLSQEHLERRMDKGFVIKIWITECTFNPFVVGSTPAGPTSLSNEIKHLEQSKCFFSALKV